MWMNKHKKKRLIQELIFRRGFVQSLKSQCLQCITDNSHQAVCDLQQRANWNEKLYSVCLPPPAFCEFPRLTVSSCLAIELGNPFQYTPFYYLKFSVRQYPPRIFCYLCLGFTEVLFLLRSKTMKIDASLILCGSLVFSTWWHAQEQHFIAVLHFRYNF